jgi:hypothetical protein
MSAEQAKSLLDFAGGLRKDVENMLNGLVQEQTNTHRGASSCSKLSVVDIQLTLIRRMVLFGLLIEHSFCIIRL